MKINSALLFVIGTFINSAFGDTVLKADAPEDPDDKKKYGFGSIWPGKDDFFKRKRVNKKTESKDVALKAKQVSPSETMSKKDNVWNASLKVLKKFSLIYVNKDSGVIKTDESYVHEFDNTDSCKYKITVNVTTEGEVSIHITSSDDSQTRIKRHEELLKSRIITASSEIDESKNTNEETPSSEEKEQSTSSSS
jgi:hypothetical protein